MLKIPVLYFLAGTSDQITKKREEQSCGGKNKNQGRKKNLFLGTFLFLFSLDVRMHKDESGIGIEITYGWD